jgi:hypothetical protein
MRLFHHKHLSLGVAIGVVACQTAAPGGDQELGFQQIKYLVGVLAEAPNELTVSRDGHARFVLHTNETRLTTPEIGTYETPLPRADLERLTNAAARDRFAALPDHSGRIPAGDGYRMIGLDDGTSPIEKWIAPDEPVDSRLADLQRLLDGIVDYVLNYPRQVLLAEVTNIEISGTRVTATVRFSNPGSEAVYWRAPVALMNAPDGWLSFHVWQNQPNATSEGRSYRWSRGGRCAGAQPAS